VCFVGNARFARSGGPLRCVVWRGPFRSGSGVKRSISGLAVAALKLPAGGSLWSEGILRSAVSGRGREAERLRVGCEAADQRVDDGDVWGGLAWVVAGELVRGRGALVEGRMPSFQMGRAACVLWETGVPLAPGGHCGVWSGGDHSVPGGGQGGRSAGWRWQR